MISCRFCDKTMKKGSIFVHVKRFHTQKKEDIMVLTEVSALNKKLDQSMDQSIQEIINSIDSQQEIFQNINMEEYMQVFDEVTSLQSKTSTEEEFDEIQQYWLNLAKSSRLGSYAVKCVSSHSISHLSTKAKVIII